MNYTSVGHSRNQAVHEQLLCMLPKENHSRSNAPGNNGCLSIAKEENGRIISTATVYRDGQVYNGICSQNAPPCDTEEFTRVLTYCVKTALYRALLPIAGCQQWGSLTGVKPAKPLRLALRDGLSEEKADQWLAEKYDVKPARRALCLAAALEAIKVENSIQPREIQIYAGIPFCPAKCSYCSFVSNDITRWGHLIIPYYEALLNEIAAAGELVRREGLPVGSIYIGGGTPTTLSAEQLDGMLSAMEKAFLYKKGIELTVEAGRPETMQDEKLDVLRVHNVTRVSVNPQSMNDAVLMGVGRCHTAADIEDAFRRARDRGFLINMDLIAGLPGDTDSSLLESVRRVVGLNPENITLHTLARKHGSKLFYTTCGNLPVELLDQCHEYIMLHGYRPYYLYRQKYSKGGLENVGFCKNDLVSRYNVCMMEELSDVLALGAGGVTKLCRNGGRNIIRVANPKYPTEYIRDAESIASRKRNLLDIPREQ